MTRPLQPGDLCLITNSPSHPHIAGSCCELIRLCPPGTPLHNLKLFDIDMWNINLHGDTDWYIPTEYLMRIDGHQDTETTEQKEELTV